MPAYPWLNKTKLDVEEIPNHMRALKRVGVPYTEEEIKNSSEEVYDKTEMEALIAYLQVLGTTLK
jgi:cytochrome c oxidase cbb3-type subunit 2